MSLSCGFYDNPKKVGIFAKISYQILDRTVIKTSKGEFPASEYQQKIFAEVECGAGNMVITAAAGSAKTTTIENCMRFIHGNKRVLYVAFNISTVDKLKTEMGGGENIEIYTFHGLGSRILTENGIFGSGREIDDFKYSRYIKENLTSLTDFGEVDSLGVNVFEYVDNIRRLVGYARYYLKMTVREIKDVSEIYGIVPIRDEFEVVRKCLIWGKENTESIDHTDLIWLPNVLNLTTKKYTYDYIFIDEAQDMTLARQGLIDKVFRRGARFIAVGDKKQQINVWCGATEESLDNYVKRPNTKVFNLPISYRIPKVVEPLAKKYSPDIVAGPCAKEGVIRTDVSPMDARANDLVLCRMSSNLIELYLKYIKGNKSAYLKGSDSYREKYEEMILGTGAKRIDQYCATKDGLMPKLYTMFFDNVKNTMERLNIDEDEALSHPDVVNMMDSIQAIRVLGEGFTTVDELLVKIRTIFCKEKKDAIVLSTIHKAKGLEAKNVFILAPSLLENPAFARTKWEFESEKNLAYVAITRASETLNFIKEDERGFFNNYKKSTLRESLDDIKRKMGYVPTEIDQTANTSASSVKNTDAHSEKKKKKGGLKFANLMNN